MHAEGPDHIERMKRAVAEAEAAARQAPAHLQPVFQFSLSQARANLEVIFRFGRFPHRNVALSRPSTRLRQIGVRHGASGAAAPLVLAGGAVDARGLLGGEWAAALEVSANPPKLGSRIGR